MRRSNRRFIFLVGFPVAAALGLWAGVSTASKSFTLAMEKGQRADWDKAFNETLAEPFATIACTPGKKDTLLVGEGCVDAGSSRICCDSWSIAIECSAAKKWQQQSIEGASCERRAKAEKD